MYHINAMYTISCTVGYNMQYHAPYHITYALCNISYHALYNISCNVQATCTMNFIHQMYLIKCAVYIITHILCIRTCVPCTAYHALLCCTLYSAIYIEHTVPSTHVYISSTVTNYVLYVYYSILHVAYSICTEIINISWMCNL